MSTKNFSKNLALKPKMIIPTWLHKCVKSRLVQEVEQLYLLGGKKWMQMVFHIMEFRISKEMEAKFTYNRKGSKRKSFCDLLLTKIVNG